MATDNSADDLVEPEVPDWDETYAEEGAAMALLAEDDDADK